NSTLGHGTLVPTLFIMSVSFSISKISTPTSETSKYTTYQTNSIFRHDWGIEPIFDLVGDSVVGV
ncbi:MAG: hypothetical protein WCG00_13895, partial [Hyphomicrobiales bacterium]